MRIPESLSSLVDAGIVEEVLRPLMSGKEAQIYLLRSAGELRVAKVYKAAQDRSFRQRAEYTEGRTVRNTRDQRALSKRTRHGREQDEIAWRATEVDMIYRLHAAGVRVPTPYHFIDGVLIMELIVDSEGDPAARLGDVDLDRESALEIYEQLIRYVVQMLCADVVHGDLSGFNVLMAADGPVIIDFPQAVNAAGNQNARKLLLRDVDNLHDFLARYVPEKRRMPYAEEMWQLYQRGELTPDAQLTGRYRAAETKVNTALVLDLIGDAERDERHRRSSKGLSMRGVGLGTGTSDPRQASPTRAQNPAQQRGQRPDPHQARPARAPAHNPSEQRRQRPDDTRQPQQPARAPHPEQRRQRPDDTRQPQQPARGPHPAEQRRQRPDDTRQPQQPARAQYPAEQRRQRQDDTRQPQQPARGQHPAEQRRQRPDLRQPARAQPAVEQRHSRADAQPSRAQTQVDYRRQKPDPRQAQPARVEQPVEYRRPKQSPQPARGPNVAEQQRQPQRDARMPQPSQAQSASQSRGRTPPLDSTRSPSNPPLPAAGAKRPQPRRD